MRLELQMKTPADRGGAAFSGRSGSDRRRAGRRHRARLVRLSRRNEFAQIVEDGVADDRIGPVGRFDQRANIVLGRQGHRDQLARGRDLALADLVESGLEFVREGRDPFEAEHRARSFDREQGAKG